MKKHESDDYSFDKRKFEHPTVGGKITLGENEFLVEESIGGNVADVYIISINISERNHKMILKLPSLEEGGESILSVESMTKILERLVSLEDITENIKNEIIELLETDYLEALSHLTGVLDLGDDNLNHIVAIHREAKILRNISKDDQDDGLSLSDKVFKLEETRGERVVIGLIDSGDYLGVPYHIQEFAPDQLSVEDNYPSELRYELVEKLLTAVKVVFSSGYALTDFDPFGGKSDRIRANIEAGEILDFKIIDFNADRAISDKLADMSNVTQSLRSIVLQLLVIVSGLGIEEKETEIGSISKISVFSKLGKAEQAVFLSLWNIRGFAYDIFLREAKGIFDAVRYPSHGSSREKFNKIKIARIEELILEAESRDEDVAVLTIELENLRREEVKNLNKYIFSSAMIAFATRSNVGGIKDAQKIYEDAVADSEDNSRAKLVAEVSARTFSIIVGIADFYQIRSVSKFDNELKILRDKIPKYCRVLNFVRAEEELVYVESFIKEKGINLSDDDQTKLEELRNMLKAMALRQKAHKFMEAVDFNQESNLLQVLSFISEASKLFPGYDLFNSDTDFDLASGELEKQGINVSGVIKKMEMMNITSLDQAKRIILEKNRKIRLLKEKLEEYSSK